MSQALAPAEIFEFEQLEKLIEEHVQTFTQVGNALLTIRDKRLYRRDYNTFEAYLQERWKMNRHRASQLINASAVVQALPNNLVTAVTTERAARELSKIEPEHRVEVVKAAAKNGPVTAPAIAAIRAKLGLRPKDDDIPLVPDKSNELPAPPVPYDMMGFVVPKDAREFWARRGEILELMSGISKIKCEIERLRKNAEVDPLCRFLPQETVAQLEHARYCVSTALPYAVCLKCQGVLSLLVDRFCPTCKGTGLMSKEAWQGYPYPELKALRQKQCHKEKASQEA